MKTLFSLILLILASNSFSAPINHSHLDKKLNNKWIKKITPDSMSHFTVYSGPSLDFKASPNKFDGTADPNPQNSWHQISFRYKINNQYKFVVNPRFSISYGNASQGGNKFELVNPVFGINAKWYKKGNLSISGGINTVAFVFNQKDQDDGLLLNPGGFQSLSYKVNNKFGVGTWFWTRIRYYQNNPTRTKMPMFVSPFVTYFQSDKISYTSFYQYNGAINKIDNISIDADDSLSFMMTINLAKSLTLQPVVTLYRATQMQLASGNFNLWVSGLFF